MSNTAEVIEDPDEPAGFFMQVDLTVPITTLISTAVVAGVAGVIASKCMDAFLWTRWAKNKRPNTDPEEES